jgi:uncharacterized membrane protein YadS
MGLSFYQYGVLAGMTIYAVPQVLAAAVPVSAISSQMGTLVKLVRVLLLGPVIIIFSLTHRTAGSARAGLLAGAFSGSLWDSPPWPRRAVSGSYLAPAESLRTVSRWLTVMAMAALGLEVQLQTVRHVGGTVAVTVVLSLLGLVLLSIILMQGLSIG